MVVGEDFWLRIPMNNESAGRHLCMDDVEVIHAWLESGYGGCWTLPLETDGEQLEGVAVKVPGSRLGLGTYAVVMAGKFVNGGHFRTKRQLFIRLVDREEQADAKPTMFNEEKAYWAGPAVLSGMLSRDGLNTYELAVLHGYDGTLEQFLAQAGIELQDFMVTKAKLSREVQTQLDKGEEKGITPMGAYSSIVKYRVNDMVYDATTNSSYISLFSENRGHAVTDTNWWKKTFDGNYVLNAIMTAAQQTLNEAKAATEQATADAIAATEDATSATEEAIAAKNAANAVAAQKVAQAQIGYYECNSLATDATKVTTSGTVGTDSYVITENGGQMKIRMNKANSVDSNVKLQIGNTTALPLYYNGLPASSSNSWEEGEVLSVYYYDNKYWASNAQGGGGKAEKIKYDSSENVLDAENVQEAIDEVSDIISSKAERMVFYPAVTTGVQTDISTTPTTWKVQTPRKIYFIPYTYKEGDFLSITANSTNGSSFAFLTSDTHTVGSVVPFAIENQRDWEYIPSGEHREVKIPSNTTFICINSAYDATSFTPSSLIIVNKKTVKSEELFSNIEELGSRCVDNGIESYDTEASLGTWNGDTGTIAGLDNQNRSIRAHLQISAKGYEKIKVVIPTGYYVIPFFVDDKLIAYKQVGGWVDGTVEIESDGKFDVILNIKKGSAGTDKMTYGSLLGVVWKVELSNNKGYIPAASFNEVKDNCEYSEIITGIKIGNVQSKFIVKTGPDAAIRACKFIKNAPKGKYHIKVSEGYYVIAYGYTDGTINIPMIASWENEATFVNNHYETMCLSFKYGDNVNFTQEIIDNLVVELTHFPVEPESVMLLNSEKQPKIASLCRVAGYSNGAPFVRKYFAFAHITDTHGVNKTISRAVEYLNDNKDIDMLLHTGDIQRKSFNDAHVSMVVYNAISEVMQSLNNANKPFLLALGNHDQNGAGGNAVTLGGIYDRFMQPMVDKGWLEEGVNIDAENNATWYYKDFSKYGIRFICLNSFDPLYDGYETSKGMDDNFIKYSQGQITWLINTLQSVPANYHVVIAMHTPYDKVAGDYPTIINPDWSSTSKVTAGTHGSTQPTKMSGSPMLDVLAAYKEKTTVTQSYSYNESAVQTRLGNLTVDADFSEANGELAFIAIGHNHDDWIGEFRSKANIKCVCLPGSIATEADGDVGRGYMEGTTTEWQQRTCIFEQEMQGRSQDSINVYIVRTDLRKVYIVKVGADFTYDARDRILTSFEY